MTNATIFNGENDNPPANQPAATTDGSLFTALVGETQKYKTPDKYVMDEHINVFNFKGEA